MQGQSQASDPLYSTGKVGQTDPKMQMTDTTPIHDAAVLTAGGRVARIHLDGQFYALRITRQGKLILTK